MKSKKVTIVLVVVLVAMVFLIPAIHVARANAKRISCYNNLRAMGKVFAIYGMDKNNAFPPHIAAVCDITGTCYMSQPKIFLCKGSHSQVGSLVNVDEWMDYIYIPWSTGVTNTPSDYPVMYDRRLSNHQGKGINVSHIDGSVTWDEGAKELKEFAVKHPDLHIQLPEDLK